MKNFQMIINCLHWAVFFQSDCSSKLYTQLMLKKIAQTKKKEYCFFHLNRLKNAVDRFSFISFFNVSWFYDNSMPSIKNKSELLFKLRYIKYISYIIKWCILYLNIPWSLYIIKFGYHLVTTYIYLLYNLHVLYIYVCACVCTCVFVWFCEKRKWKTWLFA